MHSFTVIFIVVVALVVFLLVSRSKNENFGCGGSGVPTVRESSCVSCAGPDQHVCLQAAGTYDGGSTWLRNLPCPVSFPPVVKDMKIIAHKQLMHTSELDVFQHLEKGGLVIAANDGNTVDYALKTLMANTYDTRTGYPNFYYINGAVLVMTKINGVYFWMIDYPIKYNPENIANYVNSSTEWNVAKGHYNLGKNLLNRNAPVFFMMPPNGNSSGPQPTPYACMPTGQSQSSTDVYYPGCVSKSCLWGPKFGSGNWTLKS